MAMAIGGFVGLLIAAIPIESLFEDNCLLALLSVFVKLCIGLFVIGLAVAVSFGISIFTSVLLKGVFNIYLAYTVKDHAPFTSFKFWFFLIIRSIVPIGVGTTFAAVLYLFMAYGIDVEGPVLPITTYLVGYLPITYALDRAMTLRYYQARP